MKALLTCLVLVFLLVFSRISLADTLHDSYTSDLSSWRSGAVIKLRRIHSNDYKWVMAWHSTIASNNLSFLSFRDRFLEGSDDPENGLPRARIHPSYDPPDSDWHDVGVASEPNSLVMLGTGLFVLAVLVKRRIKRQLVKAA